MIATSVKRLYKKDGAPERWCFGKNVNSGNCKGF